MEMLNQKMANEKVELAIKTLIDYFLSNPTIYLEEKHLHNEFDRIFRTFIPNHLQTTKTKDGENFPVIMNEYATVHKYSANEHFKKTYDNIKGYSTGSLDYVVLDPIWINKNEYISCVNKNEGKRDESREKKENRFLVTIEFKFMHVTKEQGITPATKESRQRKIILETIKDAFKQINESAPAFHVVYFNSDIPVNKDQLIVFLNDNIIKDIYYSQPTNLSNLNKQNMFIWYIQAGLKRKGRFEENDSIYSIAYSYKNSKPELFYQYPQKARIIHAD